MTSAAFQRTQGQLTRRSDRKLSGKSAGYFGGTFWAREDLESEE
jgi:hypothetical protein